MSLGTLAGTVVERLRVWHAIDGLGTRRRGWIELGRVDDGRRLEEMETLLCDWVSEGRVDKFSIEWWKEGAQKLLEGTPETGLPQDWKCKVSTRDGNDHDMLLAALRVACSERGGTGGEALQLTKWRPRASVVQRRIALELAPEIGIEAQEEIVRTWCEGNLAEVSWHACIHRESDGRDAWRDRAYVVYTQFPLQVELDEYGWPTGWWTFERARRLPSPAAMVKDLWGKGAQGRAGTQALIERWRNRLVELQNSRLEADGVGRRYRTSAHRRDGPGTLAPVRSMPAHGRGGIDSSSGDAGSGLMPERGAGGVAEPWLERWRDALAGEPEGHHVGRIAASIFEAWSAEEKWQRARDPRPEVRALYAHARRWQGETVTWRSQVRRICDTWAADEEGVAKVERLIEALSIHGTALETVATREQLSSLEQARRCGRAVRESKSATVAYRRALDVERLLKIIRKWRSGHGQLVKECAACTGAWNALKVGWAARSMELEDAGRLLASRPDEERERLRRARAQVLPILSRSAHRDGEVAGAAEFTRFRKDNVYTIGEDLILDALVADLLERVDKRRQAIVQAGQEIGVTAHERWERRRQIAQLTPTAAAQWVGRDLEAAMSVEGVMNSAMEPLRQFVPVAKRRLRKVTTQARPGEEDRAVAQAFSAEERAVLDWMATSPTAVDSRAREVAQAVSDATSRTDAQDRQFVEGIKAATSKFRDARDPRERSTLRTKLAEELAQERARTSLSRVEWMRLARESGLGRMEVADGLRYPAERD